jgi:hypothetical protein
MKKKIDRYFTEHYLELIEVSSVAIDSSNRNYDPSDVVSTAYEYVVKSIGDIETEEDIKRFAYRICLMYPKWRTSPLNREMLLKQSPFEGLDDYEPVPVECDTTDILDKIRLEKWYNDKKSILELYRIKLRQDKAKLVLLDKMIQLKTRNHRTLAEIYDIPHTTMYLMIKDIQEGLQDFEREVNKYDQKNNINR